MAKSEFANSEELSVLEKNLIHLLREISEQHSLEINSRFKIKIENIINDENKVSGISPELWTDIGNKIPSLELPQVYHWLNYLNFSMLVPIPWNNNSLTKFIKVAVPPPSYTVTVTNRTDSDIFDRIVVFYKRIDQAGVVFLEKLIVIPNESVVFNLGLCSQMESYVVGFFIGDDMVAKMPSSGNMTPQMATKLNPTDTFPCEDSWSIY